MENYCLPPDSEIKKMNSVECSRQLDLLEKHSQFPPDHKERLTAFIALKLQRNKAAAKEFRASSNAPAKSSAELQKDLADLTKPTTNTQLFGYDDRNVGKQFALNKQLKAAQNYEAASAQVDDRASVTADVERLEGLLRHFPGPLPPDVSQQLATARELVRKLSARVV